MAFFNKIRNLVSDNGKAAKTLSIRAPLTGDIIPIEEVPDMVFAEKVVGDGIAIKPSGNVMVAPCDGTIGKIFETNHAFAMQSYDGIELFVHFGIDTVNLKGKGFTRIANEGQQVKTGDPIIEFDLAFLKENAESVVTPVVISNLDQFADLKKMSGAVTLSESEVLSLTK